MFTKKIKCALFLTLNLLTAATAFAQEVGLDAATPPGNAMVTQQTLVQQPNFWLAIVVGVLLAVSFELIMTHLSMATGISVIGPFDQRNDAGEKKSHSSSVMEAIKKTSNYLGIWTLVTVTISLLFASWLGIRLANTADAFRGLVLGLAIWALFYIIVTALEMTIMSSLVGMFVRTAMTGLQSIYKTTASIFGKSQEDRTVDTVERITATVRQELFGDMDAKDFRKELQRYIGQLRPASPTEIKDALLDVLDDLEIKALVEHEGDPFSDVDKLTASLVTDTGMSRDKAHRMAGNVKDAISKIREEYKSEDKTASISDAALRLTGRSEEEARSMREKFENYLRSTGKEELDPEGIKRDLDKLFTHPKEGIAALQERLSHFNLSSLKAILKQRTDMTDQDADRISATVMDVINKIRGKKEETMAQISAGRQGAEDKVRNYLNSLNRPELRYEDIKQDLAVLFHDPRAGADLLIQRLKSMDRDSIKALLASRRDMSPEDAERLLTQIEDARDQAITKYEQMKMEIQNRLAEAREKAMIEAEEARQVARNAAWWSFGSATLSAVASVVGGILATYTG